MKKTLLYFTLLLFTNHFYAQVNNIEHCAGDTNFDLTVNKSLLLGNLNPLETTISYHVSLEEANLNTNAIQQPTQYFSQEPSKTIYARIDNKGTITTNYFNLILNTYFTTLGLVTKSTCYGSNDAFIRMQSSGGKAPYAYRLVNNGTNNGPYQISPYFYNLAPGQYSIESRDQIGCLAVTFVNISSTNQLVAQVAIDDQSLIVTASGGTGTYQYSLDGMHYQNERVFINLAKGTYTVYVKDSNGCVASQANLSINPRLRFTPTVTEPTCSDPKGTITIVASGGSGGYFYSIDNGVTYSTAHIFTGIAPGNYTLKVRDSENTIVSYAVTIKAANPPIFTFVSYNVYCKGGQSGFFTIQSGGVEPASNRYSLNGGPFSSKTVFSSLKAGTYNIVAKNNTDCITSMDIVITEPATPLVSVITVKDQTITVNAQGGTGEIKYAISPNLNNFSTNNTFSNLAPGIYQVHSQDQNGCYTVHDVAVTPAAPLVNGKNEIIFDFKPGQTLADVIVQGQNIKWYSNKSSSTGKKAETDLPLTTVLVNGTTYYASQTINGLESTARLAVTAKSNGSLSTPDFDLTHFKFYPNPVKHLLTIDNKEVIDEIEIFSTSGKSVLSKKINTTHSEIDLSNLSTGIYILKVKSDGKEKAIKISKE
ncbi:T9SS type A sorting domain-containing protein [Flavobacterium poyangense]|uniref:T9SS type A sorting domain-containing protein n=1 Tax=Flavobacterium poyangense TaxID=2204302 RepID=UPI00142306EC|nr:T9SS type A sorting domain-containing protein [Flavobacterium sp. JXAS1]